MAQITGVGYGGTSGSGYNLYVKYNLISQNEIRNESIIEVEFKAQGSSSVHSAWNGTPQPYNIHADGQNRRGTKEIDFRNRNVVNFGTERFTIKHNNDGRKTINFGGNFTISGVSSIRGGNLTGNWTLPRILSVDEPSISADYIEIGGDPITVYTNSPDSSFRYDMTFMLGNRRHKFADKVQVSETFQITAEEVWAREMPDSINKNATIRVVTYSGTGKILKTQDLILPTRVPQTYEYIPRISSLSVVIAGDGIDKELGEFIEGISRIKVSYDYRAGLGATIKSRKLIIAGTEYAGSEATSGITRITGLRSIEAHVKDTRNRTDKQVESIVVQPYSPPKLDTFKVERNEGTNQVRIIRDATWSPVNNKNELTVTIDRREVGESWKRVSQDTYKDTSGHFTETTTYDGVSELKSYEYRIILKDTIGRETTANLTLPTAIVPMSWGETGIGVGKVTEGRATLEVLGNTELDGNLDVLGKINTPWGTLGKENGYHNLGGVTEKVEMGSAEKDDIDSMSDMFMAYKDKKNNDILGLKAMNGIVEEGSNYRGEFIKFGNGLMICQHYDIIPMTVNTSHGSIYRSNDQTWTYPATFVGRPYVHVQDNITLENVWEVPLTISTGSYKFRMFSVLARSARDRHLSMFAIGRWK